ncbi:SAM-dependent DNA methyltransferase [Rhizobium laguerreae]|uniref:type I restriction-modification system subunit M n=1 Tax=Rhizobium laguerreae TaxID=1076926 RepID=UPI001C917826|nr:class I SAM-dependent DNA methyltransferase [Rhizobium laguerreae]MBY3393570.1 SAM-dependent DNA methyltransferase [Rhizobium laguerreae]
MAADLKTISDKLWTTADKLRANSGILPAEYARPVLGLLFLRHADERFTEVEARLAPREGSRIKPGPEAYKSEGAVFLPPEARFSFLLALPEGSNLGRALTTAMREIEAKNPELADVLPKTYQSIPDDVLVELLRELQPLTIDGDAFGHVYEYFMGNFAKETMQKGGEFYTPSSIVRLIVEIIEPYHGRILDPACGSGGMFVHSADFVKRHQKEPDKELSIYGVERTRETWRLAQMNLAVHGLSGKILDADTYREPVFEEVMPKKNDKGRYEGPGGFDFVMANPPFNVKELDKSKLLDVANRFPHGVPSADNANYLWIQFFWSRLNETGRAGFVMANSAADARGTEQEIRKKLIESGSVDVIVSVGPNFFLTVTLPCTLWFFNKGKATGPRADEVLFLDARHIFRQIDRAHRDFTEEQVESLANIVRLWRGEEPEFFSESKAWLKDRFPNLAYGDVAGLCRSATRAQIESEGWSLNPGRYVGVAAGDADDEDFREKLEELHEELEALNVDAARLQTVLSQNLSELLS